MLKTFEADQADCNAEIELSPQSLNAGVVYCFLSIMRAIANLIEATCAAFEQGARLERSTIAADSSDLLFVVSKPFLVINTCHSCHREQANHNCTADPR